MKTAKNTETFKYKCCLYTNGVEKTLKLHKPYMEAKMDLTKMIIVPSKSRYELEIDRKGSEEEARKKFGSDGVWDYIRESHAAQKENLEKVRAAFDNERIVDRSLLTPELISEYDTFVFLGGDNHFTYCCQEILKYMQQHPEEQKDVIGTVLDSKKSLGALLYYDVDRFLGSLPKFEKGEYDVENWTTLEAVVRNGTDANPHPAVNDYFIGEYGRLFMSRNRVFLDGKEIFPDKSSGILVVTGSGSDKGSWYNNVHQVMFDTADAFGKEEECARVILTEHESKSKLVLRKGQSLIIDSYNDDQGILTPDSHREHEAEFRIGAQAEVRISDVGLKVVR